MKSRGDMFLQIPTLRGIRLADDVDAKMRNILLFR